MTAIKPGCLVLNPMTAADLERLGEELTIHDGSAAERREALLAAVADRVRCVLTIGTVGLDAALVARLPALEIVSTLGSGHEGVDGSALAARGIPLTHGRGANAHSVADHAIGLMLAVMRAIPSGDHAVRRGEWRKLGVLHAQAFGKRLAIVGLGVIGREIARRAAMGFGMEVAYTGRTAKPDAPYVFVATVGELARRSDILILAAAGGAETRHMVDAAVLDALGAGGVLVNIGRGSLVDTAALVAALRERRIGGAGLDVVDGEPNVPAELLGVENLVVTPHVAGRSPESHEAMIAQFLDNVAAHFRGERPPNLVPGSAWTPPVRRSA